MRYVLLLLLIAPLTSLAYADSYSAGPLGINARGFKLPNNTNIDGEGVGIAQMEQFRPGNPGHDLNFDDYHAAVEPHRVFQQAGDAPMGSPINDHAEGVAGVMIGDGSFGGYSVGVAPDAKLYSGAAFPDDDADDLIRTLHKFITYPNTFLGNPKVRAVNISYFWAHVFPNQIFLDGNYPLTKYVDWSANRFDITYVVLASSTNSPDPSAPTEHFNGITVVASAVEDEGGRGYYRRVDDLNVFDEEWDAAGERVSADIMAPGAGIEVPITGNLSETVDGTSFATPHVTGALALLHQVGDQRVEHQGWDDTSAHRHEVMKAVLLNSADKLRGVHGAPRTAISSNATGNYDWTNRPF
jgi:subtilisin family serine protease